MSKSVIDRLAALERTSASKATIMYVKEVLRRVRAAAAAYGGVAKIITVELPERSDIDE